MFEKFMSANAGDFRQRYHGTYGFYSRAGKKQLVQLVNVDQERGEVQFRNVAGASFSLRWDSDEDVGFEFVAPKATWHNTTTGTFLVRRIAQRQYQRGISEANTGIVSAKKEGMFPVNVNFTSLSAIFDYPATIKEASKAGVFAVSDQLLVGAAKLWLFNQAIGEVKHGKAYEIKLDDPSMFHTEVTDAFRRANLEASVV